MSSVTTEFDRLIPQIEEFEKLREVEFGKPNLSQSTRNKIDVSLETKQSKEEIFLKKWQNYLNKLNRWEAEVERRTKAGFSLENRLPSQTQLLKLSEECLTLSNEYYGIGNGNLSSFYLFFHRINVKAEATFYAYKDLPLKTSKDGYVTILDLDKKTELQNKYNEEIQAPYLRQGGARKTGRSPIDDSNRPLTLPKDEGKALLASYGLKRFMVAYFNHKAQKHSAVDASKLASSDQELKSKLEDVGQLPAHTKNAIWDLVIKQPFLAYIQKQQIQILNKISHAEPYFSKKIDLLSTEATVVRKILQEDLKSLSELGFKTDTPFFKLLQSTGKPLTEEDWSLIFPSNKKELTKVLNELLKLLDDAFFDPIAGTVFEHYGKFLKSNPGEFFLPTSIIPETRHYTPQELQVFLHAQGTKSENAPLRHINRTALERKSPVRYFPYTWKRKFPLASLTELIRAANSLETSRTRANQGLYSKAHGMSMSSNGLPEGFDARTRFLPLFQSGIPIDPTASKVANIHCDIEKILRELAIFNPRMNPKTGKPMQGEGFLTVGQNSAAGSSIKQTQHTQISEGVLEEFPLYNNAPKTGKFCEKLQSEINCIQVGNSEDAFYLRITTDNPQNDDLIKALIDLKMSLLKTFGGNDKIDFHFHGIPRGDGKFVIVFAPLTRLVQNGAIFINPDLGKSHKDLDLPVEHIHLSNACASPWGVSFTDQRTVDHVINNGEKTLRKLWDFTAKKGAFDHVQKYLQEELKLELKEKNSFAFKKP